MAGEREPRKSAHVWAWLVTGWLVSWVVAPLWVPIVAGVALAGLYALVCRLLPTYDCPRCAGNDTRHGLITGSLRGVFGGNRFGCRSKRCHNGQRTRLGVRVFQPARAQWLADNPGRAERLGV